MKPFESGEKVLFLGDSITAANHYVAQIADYYVRHLPERRVQFANAGIAGATVSMGLEYLEEYVLSARPDCVTVMYGVNDSGRELLASPDSPAIREELAARLVRFRENLVRLIGTLRAHGVEVVLFTPPPYVEFLPLGGELLHGAYALVLRYAECVRKLAREYALPLVDLHAHMAELHLAEEGLYNPDRVHPTLLGHMRMAAYILQAQGFSIDAQMPGEAIPPLTESVQRWHNVMGTLSNLRFVDAHVIHQKAWTTDERLAFVQAYLENKRYPSPFFEQMALHYLTKKPQESEFLRQAETRMRELYDV